MAPGVSNSLLDRGSVLFTNGEINTLRNVRIHYIYIYIYIYIYTHTHREREKGGGRVWDEAAGPARCAVISNKKRSASWLCVSVRVSVCLRVCVLKNGNRVHQRYIVLS